MKAVGIVAASFLLSACAAAQLSKTEQAQNRPVEPHRIAGNLYYVGAADIAVFLVATPQGHILINTGYPETVPVIRDSMKKLGFKFEDVRIILASHAHIDHIAGCAKAKELSGAKVMITDADAGVVEGGGKGDFRWEGIFSWQPCRVDRRLRDAERVELGGASLVAHITPGHTRGNTTWTTVIEDGGKRYDVVIVGSTSINPGVRLVGNAKYPNIAVDYARTFAVLKSLPCDIFLASHASFYGMQEKLARLKKSPKQNPFVDPEGYREFVARAEQTFLAQLARER